MNPERKLTVALCHKARSQYWEGQCELLDTPQKMRNRHKVWSVNPHWKLANELDARLRPIPIKL